MATEGVNLLGANQWQALQFQEAAKNQAVIPHAQDANVAILPLQVQPLTPTQTSQAVHLEAMPDRLDLSTGDSLKSNGGQGNAHAQDSPEEELQNPEDSSAQHWQPTTLEEARNHIARLTPAELLQLSIDFLPTTGERQQLAALLPTTTGPFSTYARQANLTAGPAQLLVRSLHVCANQDTASSERTIKILSVLKAATATISDFGGLFSLLLERSLERDPAVPALLEELTSRLETALQDYSGPRASASKDARLA